MDGSLTGSLLLSNASLFDPNFRKTIVLVGHHDEDGAVGVVLNRALEVTVDEAVPPLSELVPPGVRSRPSRRDTTLPSRRDTSRPRSSRRVSSSGPSASNRVTVGGKEMLFRDGLVARRVNFLSRRPREAGTMKCLAKIRYNHSPVAATLRDESGSAGGRRCRCRVATR